MAGSIRLDPVPKREGAGEEGVEVLFDQVAGVDQGEGVGGEAAEVFFAVAIALGQLVLGEGYEAGQEAGAVLREAAGEALHVPGMKGAERNGQEGHADAAEVVAVGVDLGYQGGVAAKQDRWLARVGPGRAVGSRLGSRVGRLPLQFRRHQQAVGDFWVAARRRLSAFFEPGGHGVDQGVGERPVGEEALQVLGFGRPHGRERAADVAVAVQDVDPRGGRDLDVGLAIGGGVDQGSAAAPIFVAGIEVEDFGHHLFRAGAVEQAGLLAGCRVGRGKVGEREDVDRIEGRHDLPGIARGLGEAVVEVTAAGAGDVDQQAIENLAAFFVGVETFVNQVAKEAAALGNAEAESLPHRGDRFGIVLEVGNKIAHRGQTGAHQGRVGGGVDDFVDLARLEAALEADGGVAGEAPGRARQEAAGRVDVVALGELVRRAFRIGHAIALAAEGADDDVAEGMLVLPGGDDEVRAHQAAHPPRHRSFETQTVGLVAHVELPAEPSEGVAAAKEEIVPRRIRGEAETSPVRDLEMENVVAARGRLQQHQVRHHLRLRDLVDVGDREVVGIFRVEREVDLGFDPLVAKSQLPP